MKLDVCSPICQSLSVVDPQVHPETQEDIMNEATMSLNGAQDGPSGATSYHHYNKVERRMKNLQPDVRARYSREVIGLNGESDSKIAAVEYSAIETVPPVWKRLSQSDDDISELPGGFTSGTVPRRKKKFTSDGSDSDDDASSVASGESNMSKMTDRYGFIGGSQYTLNDDLISAAVARRRERKWLSMLKKWDLYMKTKFQKLRQRCRKGIPSSVRPLAWQKLCGADKLLAGNLGMFEDLLSKPGDPRVVDEITRDLHRQFPLHEMFEDKDGPGQAELFKVLKAYSLLNPVVGYCQGQAPIASVLLMHMPSEQAFWCLVAVCDRYVPGYYSQGLEQVVIDGNILLGLLKKVAPVVHKHLEKQKIDPVLFMMEWFMCIYARSLPWPTVLRVWDMFLCEGVKVLFSVGLVLLKFSLGRGNILKQCPTMYETLQILKELPNEVTKLEFLIPHVEKLNVSIHDFEKEHKKQLDNREKAKAKKKD